MCAVWSLDERYRGFIPDGPACACSAAAASEGLEVTDSTALPTQFFCLRTRDRILCTDTAQTPEAL